MKIELVYDEIKRLDNPAFIESLNYNGINLWPLLRYHLLLKFKDGEVYMKSVPSDKSFNGNIFSRFRMKRKATLERNRFNHSMKPVLFIDEFRYNSDKIEGEFYNRHIQPYQELISDYSSTMNLTLDEELQEKSKSNYFNPWYFYLLEKNISDFDIEILKKNNVSINFQAFKHQAKLIGKWKNYFLDLFKENKPKLVLMPCFYGPVNFGLIAACKKLEIKTVDIQHGKQGKYHPIYFGWNYFPNEGYEILPDYFWVWSDYFKNVIEEAVNHAEFPKIIAGGNAWMMREKKSISNFVIPERFRNSKNVLVAVQPIEMEFTIDFIRKAAMKDSTINWLIRFHPVLQKDKQEYFNAFENITNVDLITANELKLVELFQFCQACISPWSTVVLEGLDFGLKPIIIHPNGKSIFKDDIDNGILFYCENPDSIIDIILNQSIKINSLMDTNELKIKSELKKLISE